VDGVLGAPLLKRLPVWIDPVGQRLRLGEGAVAFADTGAEGLFLSPAIATRLGPIGPEEPVRLVGFGGEQQVKRQRFAGLGLGLGPARVEGIVTANPIFAELQVEAIVGQELLHTHRQLWRLDQRPPTLSLW